MMKDLSVYFGRKTSMLTGYASQKAVSRTKQHDFKCVCKFCCEEQRCVSPSAIVVMFSV
jgi:hypothetical protein